METNDQIRRQVSYEQLTALIDFLKQNQDLAKGLSRGRRGKFHTLNIWAQCAKKLNAIKDGAVKSEKGWSKFWCDWKYRVRRRALEMKASKENSGADLDGIVPLSPMEETLLRIIGESAIDNVTIKRDPLGAGETDEEDLYNADANDSGIKEYYIAPSRPIKNKRRLSNDKSGTVDFGGPSSSIDKKLKSDNDDLDETVSEDEASEFLRLEKEKLDGTKQVVDSLQMIRTEITRLADIMGHIRDILRQNQ